MKTFLLSTIAWLIVSCNNSANEKTNEQNVQNIIDSTRNATKHEDSNKVEIEKRRKEQQLNVRKDAEQRRVDLQYAKQNLADLQTELTVQNDNLEKVKGVRLLRTQDEREAQMRAQLNKIQAITDKIEFYKEQIQNIKSGKKYDLFQDGIIKDSTNQN